MMRVFRDRHDAGVQLARALARYAEAADVIVLAHTPSSVPVAYEIATRLALPLDVLDTEHVDAAGKIVLLVDDGGAARELPGAIEGLRECGATSVVAAVGVASPQVCSMLHAAADHAICMLTPQHIYSLEAWYADLTEPSADDVEQLLVAAARDLLRLRRGEFLIDRIDS
jgi:predicted phosphoribosyltransferase